MAKPIPNDGESEDSSPARGMIDDMRKLNQFLAAGHTLEEAQAAGLCRITKLALDPKTGKPILLSEPEA